MSNSPRAPIESHWPIVGERGRSIAYDALRDQAAEALAARKVRVGPFSHFGIVVEEVRATITNLAADDPDWAGIEPAWGAAFGCSIARRVVDGVEYELIEPVEDSFLRAALRTRGEGVQHLSFTVRDLDAGLETLVDGGAAMVHPHVCQGLHGRIAFVHLPLSVPVDLELCEEG